jgi:hypothetical protein
MAVAALRALPSYGRQEYVFPAKPRRWSGWRWRSSLGFRPFGSTTTPGSKVISRGRTLLTGHKSRELRRYQHLREELKGKTVDLIAGGLKEAGEGGNNASSSRLLHAGKNGPKKVVAEEAK